MPTLYCQHLAVVLFIMYTFGYCVLVNMSVIFPRFVGKPPFRHCDGMEESTAKRLADKHEVKGIAYVSISLILA